MVNDKNGMRRLFLLTSLLSLLSASRAAGMAFAALPAGAVRRGNALRFPRDHGAHLDSRTEWWYATGALQTGTGERLGFQVTFFRSRVDVDVGAETAGRFSPRHVLFAHGALTDVSARRQWHAQRLGRWNGHPGAVPASASLDDTRLLLGGWTLARRDDPGSGTSGVYSASLTDSDFGFQLSLATTQPLLLQGEQGFSRKGPDPAQASHYYSQPQLRVTGMVQRKGRSQAVTGTAWLDHEWSETLLHPEAVGWDWVGLNLDDGTALTVFQLRRGDGTAVWAGGSWRPASAASPRVFTEREVRMRPLRWWQSSASGGRYPVAWRLETPMGSFEVAALLDDQELDSRLSTGTVYWEGLSELRPVDGGQRLGLGYLEMTGYAGRLRL